jgi:hypothetical protein
MSVKRAVSGPTGIISWNSSMRIVSAILLSLLSLGQTQPPGRCSAESNTTSDKGSDMASPDKGRPKPRTSIVRSV